MFTVPSQSLISYHVSQFQLLEEVSKPLWIYRCVCQAFACLHTCAVPCGMATRWYSGERTPQCHILLPPYQIKTSCLWPCCSCTSQKIVWANVAALYFFSTTAELIRQLDFSKQPSGKHVTTLNELLKEEVEVST